jgi:hypothetical protein
MTIPGILRPGAQDSTRTLVRNRRVNVSVLRRRVHARRYVLRVHQGNEEIDPKGFNESSPALQCWV